MKKRQKKRTSDKLRQVDSVLLLSVRGAKIFLELLNSPEEPNGALKRACLKYKKLVKKGEISTDM